MSNEKKAKIAAEYIAIFKGDKEACLKNVFIFSPENMSDTDLEIRDEILRQLFANA